MPEDKNNESQQNQSHYKDLTLRDRLLRPPYYSYIFLLVWFIFFTTIIITTKLSLNSLYLQSAIISLITIIIYFVIESLLKQSNLGLNILNAILFCFVLFVLVIGVDFVKYQSINRDLSYLSISTAKKQTFNESIDSSTLHQNVKATDLNIEKNNGDFSFSTGSGKILDMTGYYYFADEKPKTESFYNNSEENTNVINFSTKNYQLNPNRLFGKNVSNYNLTYTSSVKTPTNYSFKVTNKSNNINITNGVVGDVNLECVNAITKLMFGDAVSGSGHISIYSENCMTGVDNISNLPHDVEIKVNQGELLLNIADKAGPQENLIKITGVSGKINISLPKSLALKIDYNNQGSLEVFGEKVEDNSGTYTSQNYESSFNKVIFTIDNRNDSTINIRYID